MRRVDMLKHHHENKKTPCARPVRNGNSLTAKETQERHSLIKAKAVKRTNSMPENQ
jgi:hypothetical protein